MEMPTRKNHCTCLEFVDSTNDRLFGTDVLVNDESSYYTPFVHNVVPSMFL